MLRREPGEGPVLLRVPAGISARQDTAYDVVHSVTSASVEELVRMTAQAWIIRILFGGLLGMLGQGLRTVSGLKKMYDEVSRERGSFQSAFEASRLVSSLFMGFIAAALAVIAMDTGTSDWTPGRQEVLTLIGAGYAGADFIEAFVARYVPKPTAARGGEPGTRKPADGEVPAVG